MPHISRVGSAKSDENVRVLRGALLIGVVLGAGACPNRAAEPGCLDGHFITAVAADADPAGTIYVADGGALGVGYPTTVARAASWKPVWTGQGDGTGLGVLAPASGGVIVVNSGAAARRFDASGAPIWTIGYGAFVGVNAALTGSDRLVVVDLDGARMFGPDGTPLWGAALPAGALQVFQVVADRADGVWILGRLGSGTFIHHLDGNGAVLASVAVNGSQDQRDSQLLVTTDAGGAAVLVLRHRTYSGPPMLDAYDSDGASLWSRNLTEGGILATDGAGDMFVLSGMHGTLTVARSDMTGAGTPTSFAIDDRDKGGFTIVTAPRPDGMLVAGERYDVTGVDTVSCPWGHFLLQIASADLTVAALPLGLR
jgi:hypothetical protein